MTMPIYTEITDKSRIEIINYLIQDRLQSIIRDFEREGISHYFNDMFTMGFDGFGNWTDSELLTDYNETFHD